MKINLARSAGFCFGVKRAIDVAYKTLKQHKNVCLLGDIVHNEDVAKQLENAGIEKINRLCDGKNKIFLIRAHGISNGLLDRAQKKGFKIIDATCPMVKEIHRIVRRNERNGLRIIVIGDRKHDEVQGIIGQLKKMAVVIQDSRNIPWEKLKKARKVCVVVQSTQNLANVLEIIEILKPHFEELKFFNTICRPTRIKQEEVKKMPLQNDVMIIIGSKTSANTKRLYKISKSLNKRSYWIQSKENIRRVWFKNAQNVGITAGASTPDTTIKEITEYIESFK